MGTFFWLTQGRFTQSKRVLDFFGENGFLHILNGFFLKTEGFSPKMYELFGSHCPSLFRTLHNKLLWPWTQRTQGYKVDLLAILQRSLDRAIFLYFSIREVRSSGVRTSITIVHIGKTFSNVNRYCLIEILFHNS